MFRELAARIRICLLFVGLLTVIVSGSMLYNTAIKGIPEIENLSDLELANTKYARTTATLSDTGISLPRDKDNAPSYFYTYELGGKTVLIKSLHELELKPDSTFYVRFMPYEGTHVDLYFSAVSAARGINKNELKNAYADRMLQYFDFNPVNYSKAVFFIGLAMFAAGLLWIAVSNVHRKR